MRIFIAYSGGYLSNFQLAIFTPCFSSCVFHYCTTGIFVLQQYVTGKHLYLGDYSRWTKNQYVVAFLQC